LSGLVRVYGGFNITAANYEGRVESSARFWIAAALRRFSPANQETQSGGGPPQSKTLARRSTAPSLMPGY